MSDKFLDEAFRIRRCVRHISAWKIRWLLLDAAITAVLGVVLSFMRHESCATLRGPMTYQLRNSSGREPNMRIIDGVPAKKMTPWEAAIRSQYRGNFADFEPV